MQDLNALSLPELFAALAATGMVRPVLELALAEDLADRGDVTTESLVDANISTKARVVTRQGGVVAGLPVSMLLLSVAEADEVLEIELESLDGAVCEPGETIATLSGSLGFLLVLERTILNLLGRMCGIATLTRRFVDAIAGTGAVICDTRKTTPGFRLLEKYAVRCGGGTLHRLGLYDAALYKDNHLAGIPVQELASRLERAITDARAGGDLRFVEVEVDRLEQLEQLLAMPRGMIDIILLDNMDSEHLRSAVEMRNRSIPELRLEASGGVTLESIRGIAETGVDRISVGALTHASPWLDVALDIEP